MSEIPKGLRRAEQFKAVRSVLDQASIPFSVSQLKRHFAIDFTVSGNAMRYILTGSKTCPRARLNAVSDVRRMIRQAQGE